MTLIYFQECVTIAESFKYRPFLKWPGYWLTIDHTQWNGTNIIIIKCAKSRNLSNTKSKQNNTNHFHSFAIVDDVYAFAIHGRKCLTPLIQFTILMAAIRYHSKFCLPHTHRKWLWCRLVELRTSNREILKYFMKLLLWHINVDLIDLVFSLNFWNHDVTIHMDIFNAYMRNGKGNDKFKQENVIGV